ncbi:substrate-binding periplasmic protein [Desulforhopalus sp. 52FAK]
MNLVVLTLLCLLTLLSGPSFAQPTLQIFYEERPPYASKTDIHSVEGLTATPVANALSNVGIPFKWKKMPFKRQLVTIKADKKNVCGIGWFKKPGREEFARYSIPIYQDKPTVVLARNGDDAVARHSDIKSLFSDNSITLLVKDSFSYGTFLDEHIEKMQPKTLTVISSNTGEMLQMLLSGRGDYFLVAEEEATDFFQKKEFSASQFAFHRFPEMPQGNNRYLACSFSVQPEIIEAINVQLQENDL